MNVSIKKRICGSFFLLVSLFVANGIVSIITLNNNRKLSAYVSTVTNPSLEYLESFEDLLISSKMYTTNWVFLRSNQHDKEALKHLHTIDYPVLKEKLNRLSSKWNNKPITDSLAKIYNGFEQLLAIEKSIMLSLQNFKDYDDPEAKLEAERLIEDELFPRTSSLSKMLSGITLYELNIRKQNNIDLEKSLMYLRMLVSVLAVTIIFIGSFLSLYMTRKIIKPINMIRHIVNDLGKGITRKVNRKVSTDEIGEMIRSVDNLSEKLHSTAAFAAEIGNRNFNTYFEPLSTGDALGKALVAMRDNLKNSDERLNEAQHISKLGNWEWNLVTDKIFWSDEIYNIFDIDSGRFSPDFEKCMDFVHPDDKQKTRDIINESLKNHLPFSFESKIISNKGIIKSICTQGKVSKSDKGDVTNLIGIAQDITELKKSQKDLEEVNRELSLLFNSIDEIFFSVNMASLKVIQVSPTCERVCGYAQAEFMAKHTLWFDIIHPDDKHIVDHEDEILARGEQVNNEYRIIHKDKRVRWVETKITPTLGKNGMLIRVDGITRDITDRKNAGEKLIESERYNRNLFNQSPVGLALAWPDGTLEDVNEAYAKIIGRTIEECKTLNYNEITPEKYNLLELDQLKDLNTTGRYGPYEKEYIHKDGHLVPVRLSGNILEKNGIKYIWSGVEDITESRKAEQDNKFKAELLNTIGQAVVATNLESIIIFWNKAAAEIYGYSTEEAIGKNIIDLIPAKQTKEQALEIMQDLSQGHSWSGEFFVQRKGGATFPVFVTDSPVYDQNHKLSGIIGVSTNITERKKAEAELNISEERYRQIVETAQEGIWMIDENNNTTFINKKICETIEYPPEEIMGKPIHDFMDEEANKNAAKHIERRKQGVSDTHDSKFITKSGKSVWTSLSTNPIFNDAGVYKGALAMITDITKRKLDEELLQRSQASLVINNFKLEQKNKELEQFAYVASHDLQEPLRTTISFVEIFRQQYLGKLDAKADKYLTYIVEASDRMRVLIKDLLDFSRIGHNKDLEQVDCNIILQNVRADIDKAITDSGAEIKAQHLPVVSGYATELKQLFQNLLLNSVKFRKKEVPLEINITAQKKNDHWQFAFKDNGIGIDEQHNDRIFIIFQRLHTRSEYQGSGIGLSHCKKIVELHHGKIWVESIPGEGSIFYFTIHSSKKN